VARSRGRGPGHLGQVVGARTHTVDIRRRRRSTRRRTVRHPTNDHEGDLPVTAPAQSVDAAAAIDHTTIDGAHAPAGTGPSSDVLEPGRVRTSDAQALVECVFDVAQAVLGAQREITRRSLAATRTATAAVANAVGDAYRLAGPTGGQNGVGAHRDGRPGA
jgi:hypothetical protein